MAGKHRKTLEPWPVLEAARRYDSVPRTSAGRHVAPAPARREPSFDDLVRGTGVMSFSDLDRQPYTPRHARKGRR